MRDVGLEVRDTDVLLRNLEASMRRYEEILQRANDVKDVLAVEAELNRVRTNIERTQAHLGWLRDRVSRATIAVRLYAPRPLLETVVSNATLFPGLRASSMIDVREGSSAESYLGAGLSFRFLRLFGGRAEETTRGAILDFDVVRSCCGSHPERSRYAFTFLLGGDYYSGLLGAGRRRWLNPYIGWRIGLADTHRRADFAGGIVVGIDLLKTQRATLDLQARALGLVGNADGAHAVVQPSLGFSIAF